MTYENRETGEQLTEAQMHEQYEYWKELADYDSYEDFLSAVTDSNGLYEVKEEKMDKRNFTGWYDNGMYELYCEDGLVIRGKTKGNDAHTVYPYKRDSRGEWDKGTPKLITYLRSAAWQMK